MYATLGLMLVVSFVVMFGLMYSMINSPGDFYLNLNQFYMTLTMVGSMLVIGIIVMWHFYPNHQLNYALIAAGILVTAVAFLAIQKQFAVGDRDFLKGMIPHHSAALTMAASPVAKSKNPQIKILAQHIIDSQKCEIAYMKALLQNPNLPYPC